MIRIRDVQHRLGILVFKPTRDPGERKRVALHALLLELISIPGSRKDGPDVWPGLSSINDDQQVANLFGT